MTGRQRIVKVLGGQSADRLPMLPIIHTGLAGHFGVPLGRFFTDPDTMAQVMSAGWQRFGFDGVQLSLGVTGEAEALGATVEQPVDAAPVLRELLLADPNHLSRLSARDPVSGGRMPLFFDAVEKTARQTGSEAFVLATLRGPLVIASQLRGIETLLIDMIEAPAMVENILAFATQVALDVGRALQAVRADGVLLGEAVCSPNFISPEMYRRQVLPFHTRLVAGLKEAGWLCVGLHICGNIVPILPDLISTGAHLIDVDYQVAPAQAIELSQGRVVLRGNLDPSSVLRFGSERYVRDETQSVCRAAAGARWIMSSGCDIPPATPAKNLTAFAETVRAASP
jgi:uroporphyrinogen decarboxylase